MSVYIKGMEMPTDGPLIFKINPDGTVSTTWKNGYKKYTAVPVPDHGRLIDADAFATEAINSFMDCADLFDDANSLAKATEIVGAFVRDINDAPTVIPAEEGE